MHSQSIYKHHVEGNKRGQHAGDKVIHCNRLAQEGFAPGAISIWVTIGCGKTECENRDWKCVKEQGNRMATSTGQKGAPRESDKVASGSGLGQCVTICTFPQLVPY